MKKLIVLSAIVIASLFAINARASIITQWTFETSVPATAGPIAAETGTGTGTAFHANTTVYSNPVGNGSVESWSSNNWSINDYYQFGTSSTGYNALSIEWDQASSSTGPLDFVLQYSLDNTTYTNIGSGYTVYLNGSPNTPWSSGGSPDPLFHFAVDLSGITVLDNASSVYFRMTDSSTTSANGGSVATTGTNRVDNVTINGTLTGATTYWDVNGSSSGLGGTGTWNTTNTNWNDNTGTGTAVTFDSSKNAFFGGTAGTVTVDTGGVLADGNMTFDVTGYTVTGNTLTIGTGNAINVTHSGDVATISSKVSGSNGISTNGNGTLVLSSASNDFSGNIALNDGTLQVSSDSNLGNTGNDIVLGGGALKTEVDLSLNAGRDVSGTGGSLDVAATKTLTINGTVNTGALALTNLGTVQVNDATQTSSVTLSTNGTLRVGSGGSGTIYPSGNIYSNSSSGATTVNGSVDFLSSNNRSFNTTAGGTLIITGNVHHDDTAAGDRVFVDGTGTADFQGDNSGLPSSMGFGFAGSAGPTVIVHDGNGLGTGEFRFQTGQLHAASSITFPTDLTTSIGAFGSAAQSDRAATYEGSDMTFNGNTFVFNGGATQARVAVNNNTTWSGGWGLSTGTGTEPQVYISGSGTLTVSGTIDEELPVTVDGLTMNVNSAMSATTANFTVINGGTLKNGVTNALNTATSLTVGDTTTSGNYNLNGFDQTLAGVHLISGTLSGSSNTLTSTSTFDVQSGTASAKLGGSVGVLKTTAGTVTLSGNNTYTGGTTVDEGTLIVAHSHGLGNSELTVNNSALTQLKAGLTAPVVLDVLSINGGSSSPTATLDITDNNMIVHNGDLSALTAQAKAAITINLDWTGTGLTSTTARDDSNFATAVGVIQNDDGGGGALYSSWPAGADSGGAVSVSQTDVLIKYTYYGDADLDGTVTAGQDYDLWLYGKSGGGTGWEFGDFDYDGTITAGADIDLWLYGKAIDAGSPLGGSVQPVPEPSTLLLAAMGLAGVAAFARRRRIAG